MKKPYEFPYSKSQTDIIIDKIENELLNQTRVKFQTETSFKLHFAKEPGVYAIFEKDEFVYVGETSELRSRMMDLRRTYNHTFRKKMGMLRLKSKKEGNKFPEAIEIKLDQYMSKHIEITHFPLHFGRKEVEAGIVSRNKGLLNKENVRGTKK